MAGIQLLHMMICVPSNYTFLVLGEREEEEKEKKKLLLFLNPHSMLA